VSFDPSCSGMPNKAMQPRAPSGPRLMAKDVGQTMLHYLCIVSAAALLGCVGTSARPRTPDIRGEVVSVTGARMTVRLDADSELLPDGYPPPMPICATEGFTRLPWYFMAIFSTERFTAEGYLGELKIEGGTQGQVFGQFIPWPKGARSVRIGDRAACQTP
jgi:hypothetical protein